MRVELASAAAIRYACQHFHYAKRLTFSFVGYNVFNEADEWCGVVCFDRGAMRAGRPFGLATGQIAELVRVALNGKQKFTSQAVALAINQFAKDAPLVQLLVSYADQEEGHVGTIYQATNWTYLGEIKSHPRWLDPSNGAFIHGRMVSPTGFTKTKEVVKCHKQSDLIRVSVRPKHKYAIGLNKSNKKLLQTLSQPYPKN